MVTYGDARLPERFWAKVQIDEGTGCWVWTAALDPHGYGVYSIRRGVARRAHRVAYEALVGAIGPLLEPDHLCRWPACVNPDHLEPVTHAENMRRGDCRRNNGNALRTHCRRGHPFTPENTYVSPDGRRRSCRSCQREKDRRHRVVQGARPRLSRRVEAMTS